MSTWLYLECRDHNPRLSSDDVGQHLHDLPRIRREIDNKNALIKAVDLNDGHLDFDSHFTTNAVRFFIHHPICNLGIRDEYGIDYPTTLDGGEQR